MHRGNVQRMCVWRRQQRVLASWVLAPEKDTFWSRSHTGWKKDSSLSARLLLADFLHKDTEALHGPMSGPIKSERAVSMACSSRGGRSPLTQGLCLLCTGGGQRAEGNYLSKD